MGHPPVARLPNPKHHSNSISPEPHNVLNADMFYDLMDQWRGQFRREWEGLTGKLLEQILRS